MRYFWREKNANYYVGKNKVIVPNKQELFEELVKKFEEKLEMINVIFNQEKRSEYLAKKNKILPEGISEVAIQQKIGTRVIVDFLQLIEDVCELKDININVNQSETIDPGIIRKNVFHDFDRFEWDENAVDFACKHHSLYGGNVLATCKGYALYAKSDNKAIVKEFAFQPSSLKFISAQIVYESNSDILIINLPADYPTEIGKYEIKKSAMALAVKDEYCRYINGIENLYLGLTLD